MGQNNYHSRWHPRLPRVGAATTRDPSSHVKPLDRVLPALHLHLAPVFASSFSRSAPVKSMASYGTPGRGPLSFSVFRDGDGGPGESGEEAQSRSKLQKRPPRDDRLRERPGKTTLLRAKPSTTPPLSQPAFVSSTTSDDPVDLSRPLANPDLPRLPEARLSSREPPASQHLARRSLQPLLTHLGRPGAPELTSGSAPRSAPRHARSTSASTDRATVHRLSSTLEPVGTPLSRRAPAALSQLWSTPSSPELSPVTCQRASLRASGIDELPADHCRFSRPFAANTSGNPIAEQQSLSDHSDTLTTNTSSIRQPASDLTDATLTDAFTDPSSLPPRQKFSFRNRRAVRHVQKMDKPDASTVKMSPKPGDRDQMESRNASSGSLLKQFSGILGDKSTNLKRSLPFMSSTTPPKPAEKMSIGAPFDVRQGAGAMSTPPRRPKAGEDTRVWGTPDLVDKKPKLPGCIDQQPEAQATTTNGKSGNSDSHLASPVHDTMRISEAERQNDSSVGKQSSDRSSTSITALPTRPTASNGLRGLMVSAHRWSRIALNDQLPSTSSDNDSSFENSGDAQQRQEQSRLKKPSIMDIMKDTFRVRRHKRSNTTVQTAVDLHDTAQQSNLRTSRSAAVLTSSLALCSGRHGGISPPMQVVTSERTLMPELPPINSGPAISVSSMSLLQSPRTDHDTSAPASKSSPDAYGSRPNEELPAFAKENSMPEGIEVAGHNGFHRMHPLRSHANAMEFTEAPSVTAPARMAVIPEDKAGFASESSAVGRATPKSTISGRNAAEGHGGGAGSSRMSNARNSASKTMNSSASRPFKFVRSPYRPSGRGVATHNGASATNKRKKKDNRMAWIHGLNLYEYTDLILDRTTELGNPLLF